MFLLDVVCVGPEQGLCTLQNLQMCTAKPECQLKNSASTRTLRGRFRPQTRPPGPLPMVMSLF